MSLVTLGCLVWATAASPATPVAAADVFYEALHGAPEVVDANLLLAAPGRFVGRAVKTQGRLVRAEANASPLELALGRGRALLRLEPAAAAMVAAGATALEGRPVEVEGFFYREAEESPARESPASRYALRAWQVRPLVELPRPKEALPTDALALSLEELVYGSGRYNGRLVRVRGRYRGSNLHRDLPEASRRGTRDWVLKDGDFAAWVTGREARGEGWDLTSQVDTDATLEVVGVPTFSGGIVRLAAREVAISPVPLAAGDTGWDVALPSHVSFTYPVPGEPLRRRGLMIIQFSKPMEPARFEAGVRVRYERAGVVTGVPRVSLEYRDRDRALVVAPAPPPPPDTDVVVELLEGIIDKDGRALAPRVAPEGRDGKTLAGAAVEQVRFRSSR